MNMWYDVIVLITIELIPVDNLVKQTSAISCLHVFYLFIYYLSIFFSFFKIQSLQSNKAYFSKERCIMFFK